MVTKCDRLTLTPPLSLLSTFKMPTQAATLRASLEKHNDTFEALLKLIPAKYYIVQEQTEEQVRKLCCQLSNAIFLNVHTGVKISEA